MKTFINGWRLLFTGKAGWDAIASEDRGVARTLLLHTVPFSLIPAVCWFYGVTSSGWEVADQTMRMTADSALPMVVMFFFACVAGIFFLGYMVHWMSTTYGDEAPISRGVTLISYTATPFFVAGVFGLFPILWLDIMVGVAVACYCIYLLYTGVGPVIRVTQERVFLYASALFAVALVSFVGLLTATVLAWDFVIAPEYTY